MPCELSASSGFEHGDCDGGGGGDDARGGGGGGGGGDCGGRGKRSSGRGASLLLMSLIFTVIMSNLPVLVRAVKSQKVKSVKGTWLRTINCHTDASLLSTFLVCDGMLASTASQPLPSAEKTSNSRQQVTRSIVTCTCVSR